MRLTKKVILIIALISFPYMNASAMLAIEETICAHLCKRITSRASYKTSKRFFGTIMDKSGKEILETAIIAKEKPPEYALPSSFFMERRRGVTLSNVNEKIFHLHRRIKMEKELLIHEDKKDKQFALFKTEGEKTIDRRVKVKEHLSPQYLPICYLHGSYKLSDED